MSIKIFEVAAWFLGRRLKLFQIRVKEEVMKEKMVRVRITDSYGVGYVLGCEYDVTIDEAKKLIEAKKAIPLEDFSKVEDTSQKRVHVENRKK